jgi:hypothetical protein
MAETEQISGRARRSPSAGFLAVAAAPEPLKLRGLPDIPDSDWLRLSEAQARALAVFATATSDVVEAALVHAFYDGKIRTEGKCQAWYEHDHRVAIEAHVWDPDRVRVGWTLFPNLDCFERIADGRKYLFVEIYVNRRDLESWLRARHVDAGAPSGDLSNSITAVAGSGMPGRPSKGKHLIEDEFRRRCETGEVLESLDGEAKALLAWYKDNYRTAQRPTVKTVTNNIRTSHRKYLAERPEKTEASNAPKT